MYKFGQISILSKEFNSIYQVTDAIDVEKIRVSEGVVANKHDARYTIGYEVEPGKIIPLFIKTPKDCISPGVSQYNESSPWKMGFNVGEDESWVQQYKAVFFKVEELISQVLTGTALSNEKFINPKLITWEGEIKTRFRGESTGPCYATGVLKVGSVYNQGSNYHLQVFLKECKTKARDDYFVSQLSDDEEGWDTVN